MINEINNSIVGNDVKTNSKKIPYSFVYFIKRDNGLVKIGKAVNFKRRFQSLYSASSFGFTILLIIATIDHHLENDLHKKFKRLRVHGEWFNPDKELLDFIDELKKKSVYDYLVIDKRHADIVLNEEDIDYIVNYNEKIKGYYNINYGNGIFNKKGISSSSHTPAFLLKYQKSTNNEDSIYDFSRFFEYIDNSIISNKQKYLWELRKAELYNQYKKFGYRESHIKKLLKYDKEEFEKGTIDNKIKTIVDNKNDVDRMIKDMIEYLEERHNLNKELAFYVWDYSYEPQSN